MFKNGMRPIHPGEILLDDYIKPSLTNNAGCVLGRQTQREQDLRKQLKVKVALTCTFVYVPPIHKWIVAHSYSNRKHGSLIPAFRMEPSARVFHKGLLVCQGQRNDRL